MKEKLLNLHFILINTAIDQKHQIKRALLASTGTFNAIYTPSEEVIVKLNGIYDSKGSNVHEVKQNKWINKAETATETASNNPKSKTNQLIESTNSPLPLTSFNSKRTVLNLKQQHDAAEKKAFFLSDDSAKNSMDDSDNNLMNDYTTDYYLVSPQMNRIQRINTNQIKVTNNKWMKSSKDLSQNRDANNLARGSGTSFSF